MYSKEHERQAKALDKALFKFKVAQVIKKMWVTHAVKQARKRFDTIHLHLDLKRKKKMKLSYCCFLAKNILVYFPDFIKKTLPACLPQHRVQKKSELIPILCFV